MAEETKRVLIVGLGRSGVAAARLAAAGGAEVWATDRRPRSCVASVLGELPVDTRTFFGGHPEESLEGVSLVVSSPGVMPSTPLVELARGHEIEVVTEVEYAWRHRPTTALAAVTGSNGKSTVTVLVAEMLRESGVAAVAGGNLGPAASELVLDAEFDVWVLEVSSFQTEMLQAMKPRAAAFLNLSQDHLERHPDMASYLAAKRRLFAFQTADDAAVLNLDDEDASATPTTAHRLTFSLLDRADAWLDGDTLMLGSDELLERRQLALGGLHNVANALAAALLARELGASSAGMARALRGFRGLEHRHLVVHSADGVQWVDDSKATNVGATLAGLRGYPDGSVHLILGGQTKGQDFTVLIPELRRAAARVYLIGVDAPTIAEVVGDVASVEHAGTLEEAVQGARAAAGPGQFVVLAPACASFDQFAGFAERGDRFADLARREEAPCR